MCVAGLKQCRSCAFPDAAVGTWNSCCCSWFKESHEFFKGCKTFTVKQSIYVYLQIRHCKKYLFPLLGQVGHLKSHTPWSAVGFASLRDYLTALHGACHVCSIRKFWSQPPSCWREQGLPMQQQRNYRRYFSIVCVQLSCAWLNGCFWRTAF